MTRHFSAAATVRAWTSRRKSIFGAWFSVAFRQACSISRTAKRQKSPPAKCAGIIKFPFWRMTTEHPNARYVCVNPMKMYVPEEIEDRTTLLTCSADQLF
jgi:hypothetical protein